MDFEGVYQEWEGAIKARAHHQHVPGLDYDDVVAEMTTCLWIAWNKDTRKDDTFAKFWWSLWLNRKIDLIKYAKRARRPQQSDLISLGDMTLLDALAGASRRESVPPMPGKWETTSGTVWRMLAMGYTPTEVQVSLRLPKRSYYGIISNWRTNEVRSLLTDR